MIKGVSDVAVRFPKCCNPLPGDEIVGFITRGKGVTIHRTDCNNVLVLPEVERVRLVEAEWETDSADAGKYTVEINIYANNRSGLLADISRTMTEKNIDILALNVKVSKQGTATFVMSFETGGREEFERIVDKIRQIPDVIEVDRNASG